MHQEQIASALISSGSITLMAIALVAALAIAIGIWKY